MCQATKIFLFQEKLLTDHATTGCALWDTLVEQATSVVLNISIFDVNKTSILLLFQLLQETASVTYPQCKKARKSQETSINGSANPSTLRDFLTSAAVEQLRGAEKDESCIRAKKYSFTTSCCTCGGRR